MGRSSDKINLSPTEEIEKYLTDEFWQNSETDLFFSPYFSEDETKNLTQRVRSFCQTEALSEGYIALTTSGTTQTADSPVARKIVLISKSAVRAAAKIVIDHYKLHQETWILNLPLFHIGGLSILARASFMKTQVRRWSKWDPSQFVRQANEDSQALLVSLVPTQIYDLIQLKERCPAQIQKVFVGGGQLHPDLFLQIQDLGWPVIQTFGMTETSAMIADDADMSHRFQPFSGVDIKIDHEDRLLVRTPGLFHYELGDNHVRKQSSHDFFRTDDLARLTKDGGFQLLGRVQNQIKILGELVHLQTVERQVLKALQLHDLQASVVALPDIRRQHRLVLCFETGSADRALLLQKLESYNAQVVGYERLQDIVEIKAFPRTDLGKLHRGKLQELLQSLQ